MDTDRPPHRSTTTTTTATNTTSELFICFTSRLSSSSSMKLPLKSILSPGRARDSSQVSLSTSLSRRLRNSGSLKGGQASPMFPATNGKKRGCSFENPEPSSPKVTCIGQVRVKTKKQGKKIRAARSRREVSFRRTEQGANSINSTSTNNSSLHNLDANHYQDFGHMGHHQFQQPQECLPHRNQRWVHLPVTICEALRAFGAEFNCFLPCRSSCMAGNNNQGDGKEGKVTHHLNVNGNGNANGSDSSCGAVFARWLMAEKIELVVGEEERNVIENEEDDMPRRSRRRHVFEDIVIEEEEDNKCEQKNEILEEEEEGRVSICIPPKNALLLMRCRSDPVKMAALANRFWECPPPQDEDEAEDEDENLNRNEEEEIKQVKVEQEQQVPCEKLDFANQITEEDKIPDSEAVEEAEIEDESKEIIEVIEGELHKQVEEEEKEQVLNEKEQVLNQSVLEGGGGRGEAVRIDFYTEALVDPDNEVNVAKLLHENENVLEVEAFDDIDEKRPSLSSSCEVFLQQEQEAEAKVEVIVAEDSTEQKEEEEEEETEKAHERSEPGDPEMTQEPETGQESKEGESQKENLLPDCLLLMMCEPKLSMEVSRETWVCSSDFIRWQPLEKKPPPQKVIKADGSVDKPKKRVSIDAAKPSPQQNRLLMQPPRSSCSFPAAPPLPPALGAPSVKTMNTMIEQKLVVAKPSSYEPFALKRCKSEPRKSSAKLAPETCFWKNRKIEPHGPATLGVGAAGIGV